MSPQEETLKRFKVLLVGALTAVVAGRAMALAAEDEEKIDAAALAKALPAATVSLQQGLKSGEAKGRPISGKFEVEKGALQLSVYTARGSQFFEIIVDHKTGRIAKSEQIKEGEDLKAAQAQSKAMAQAASSLEKATADAVKANAGYRAVSVVPEMEKGRPVAEVTLLKGASVKRVDEKLN
jgi:uncharacterized membrane protein YkoI